MVGKYVRISPPCPHFLVYLHAPHDVLLYVWLGSIDHRVQKCMSACPQNFCVRILWHV